MAKTRNSRGPSFLCPPTKHLFDWEMLLRAVSQANGHFACCELGAGYAPWAVSSLFVAGMQDEINSTYALAIEAEPTHFNMLGSTLRTMKSPRKTMTLFRLVFGPPTKRVHFP